MDYFVCSYGNFGGREEILARSKKENIYFLNKWAHYPSAIDKIKKGDVILLKDNEYIIAYGIALSEKNEEFDAGEDWVYQVRVEKWKEIKPAIHAYGIRWATLVGGCMATVKQVTEEWAIEKIKEKDRGIGYKKSLEEDNTVFQLGLNDVASWYYDDIETSEGVRASVPILQRGLVWSAQQNEILWDSLMRGIPLGSILLCPRIEKQVRDQSSTHLLLDGQQRCNSIALGFDKNPFGGKGAILWLDLDPDTECLSKTSRRYLCRVTTPAHPWGYGITDEMGKAACLEAGRVRKAKEMVQKEERVFPKDLTPFCSKLPIPMGYLMRAFMDVGSNSDAFWEEVKKYVENESNLPHHLGTDLKSKIVAFINDSQNEGKKSFILKGVQYAMSAKIVAMNAPKEIINETTTSTGENTSTLEHLFLRINRQGTRLDGEELIYSTIKSYWPEVAEYIDDCAKNRMPASKLLLCAIKATLGGNKSCSHWITVGRIREIITTEDGKKVLKYLKEELYPNCNQIDEWLRFNETNSIGLPPILYTSISHSAPELYILLLILASCAKNLSKEFVTRLTLFLYFFDYRVRSSRRTKVINYILDCCNKDGNYTDERIVEIIHSILEESEEKLLLNPIDLQDVLDGPGQDLSYSEIRERMSEEALCCFDRFNWNRELLLYAQRKYLNDTFKDYDPARKDLWSEHNRPWDYDHVKAQATVNSWKNENANDWLWSIGNFAAIPFEENRSKQAKDDFEYYTRHKEQYPLFDVEEFEKCDKDSFPKIVKTRFTKIYNELYEQVKGFAIKTNQ